MEFLLEEILFNEIIYKLEIRDIFTLCQINNKFYNLNDNIWKLLYYKHFFNTNMDIKKSYKYKFKLCVILKNFNIKFKLNKPYICDIYRTDMWHLDRRCLKKIPIELCYLINTTELAMNNNNITIMRNELFDLINLKYLYMLHNEINIIPHNICKLKELKYLYLGNNQIKIIPEEIKDLINLECIDMSNNLIEIIPPIIYKLKHLKHLSLPNNKIKEIPYELGELQIIRGISLNNNHIEVIPFELTNLKMLSSLKLNKNNLPNVYKCNKKSYDFNDRSEVWDLFIVLNKINETKIILDNL